ncbi:hypothetical protein B0H13DRAFT_2674078 [Mycena leptocephala]|nr:hypothetical protein B0H13DRAFT_2674078 [Mycena leptocephala]
MLVSIPPYARLPNPPRFESANANADARKWEPGPHRLPTALQATTLGVVAVSVSSGSDWRKWGEKAARVLRFLTKIDEHFESASSPVPLHAQKPSSAHTASPEGAASSGTRRAPSTPRSAFAVTHYGGVSGSGVDHHCLGTPWRFVDYSASERRDPATHTSDTGSGPPLHERALRHTFSVAFLARLAMRKLVGGRVCGLRVRPIPLRASFLSLTDEISDMRARLLLMFPLRVCTRLRNVVLNNGPWLHESIWSSDAGSQEWAFPERDIGTDFPRSSDEVATASSTNVSSLTVAPTTLKGAEWGVSRRKALLPVIFLDAVLTRRPRRRLCLYSHLSLHAPLVSFLHLDDLSGPSSEYPSFVGASVAGAASSGTRRGCISPLPRHLASHLGGEGSS